MALPEISARRVFVSAGVFDWYAQINIGTKNKPEWHDIRNCPGFRNPDNACYWGMAKTWPLSKLPNAALIFADHLE